MKKSKKIGLSLNKKVVSSLKSNNVRGGGSRACSISDYCAGTTASGPMTLFDCPWL